MFAPRCHVFVVFDTRNNMGLCNARRYMVREKPDTLVFGLLLRPSLDNKGRTESTFTIYIFAPRSREFCASVRTGGTHWNVGNTMTYGSPWKDPSNSIEFRGTLHGATELRGGIDKKCKRLVLWIILSHNEKAPLSVPFL